MAVHKWAKTTEILKMALPCLWLVGRGFKGYQSLFFRLKLKKLSPEQSSRPEKFKYGVEGSPMAVHKWAKMTKILKMALPC